MTQILLHAYQPLHRTLAMDLLVLYTILASFICGYSGYSFVRGVLDLSRNQDGEEESKNFRIDLTKIKRWKKSRKTESKSSKRSKAQKKRSKNSSSDSSKSKESSKSARKIKLGRSARRIAMCTCPYLYFCGRCCGLLTDEDEPRKSERGKSGLLTQCCCCCCADSSESADDCSD
ncbi:hypothetical protein M8J76_016711 [Diaphorina citri]|nr:hypothetical protein M8J75_015172 [Diaphorina citri]KAI5733846.1 hypothetical protein M8J76_016711 [Diaphorina citri]